MSDGTGCAVAWHSKVVLITGAASGMGLAFARRFAAAGASLALADLQGDRAAAIAPTLGTPSLAITADVARVADCAAMVAGAVARFGRLDLRGELCQFYVLQL